MFDLAPPAHTRLLPLQQSPLYLAALTRIGTPAGFHDLTAGRAVVVTQDRPVLGRIALISRGPVWPGVPAGDRFHGLRRAVSARVLIVNAETREDGAALARAGFVRLAADRWVAELSLDGTPEEWLARMGGKWRNRLRHGLRQGMELKRAALPPDPQHWLFALDAAQQAARGYRGLPPRFLAAMAVARPGAVDLFTAHRGGHVVAAMLFARHGGTASYLVGWTGAQGRRLSAHTVILWHAMQDLHGRGVGWIDLGQHAADRAPGLARFKRESGAVVRPLGGTWGDNALSTPLAALLRGLKRAPEQRIFPTPPRPAKAARGRAAPPESPAR